MVTLLLVKMKIHKEYKSKCLFYVKCTDFVSYAAN